MVFVNRERVGALTFTVREHLFASPGEKPNGNGGQRTVHQKIRFIVVNHAKNDYGVYKLRVASSLGDVVQLHGQANQTVTAQSHKDVVYLNNSVENRRKEPGFAPMIFALREHDKYDYEKHLSYFPTNYNQVVLLWIFQLTQGVGYVENNGEQHKHVREFVEIPRAPVNQFLLDLMIRAGQSHDV